MKRRTWLRTLSGLLLLLFIGELVYSSQPPVGARILPLGDSITYGSTAGEAFHSGYRAPLEQKLRDAGRKVVFVGTQKDDNGYSHEGHPGARMLQIAEILPTVLAASRPDYILLQMGTNDMFDSISPEERERRMQTLLDRIRHYAPHAVLLVASITPMCEHPSYVASSPEAIAVFNQMVKATVAARAQTDPHLHFVDMHEASHLTCSDMNDGLHPNNAGYAKMADVWYRELAGRLHP